MPLAWVLNFDAEGELAQGAGYSPSRATRERERALASAVPALIGEDAVVVTTDLASAPDGAEAARGLPGVAWCPTPRAREALRRAGAVVIDGPELAILRRVNHRRFGAELGLFLPGARWASSFDDVHAALRHPSPTGRWVLKRPFGFAGRGRMVVAERDAPVDAFVLASLRSGDGLLCEPWVEREADFALHGVVHRDGTARLGVPTVQECTAGGAWVASRVAERDELTERERACLTETATLTARALHDAGYFGPFNVDAYRWRDDHGEARFNPRSEINARFSMGWAAGMGRFEV